MKQPDSFPTEMIALMARAAKSFTMGQTCE